MARSEFVGCGRVVIRAQRRTVTEIWMPPAGGTMLGMSRTVLGEKTVESLPQLELARPGGITGGRGYRK